jgi:hypothetical protein
MNLQWMRDDALLLKTNGRLQGCLVLLLCLVDAQAKERCSSHSGNRLRYCSYLKTRLAEIGHDESYRIEEKNKLIHLSEIIYEYFRCFLVHEGNTRDDPSYEIQLKYVPNPKSAFGAGILIDRPNEQIVIQSEWLIELLLSVCEDESNA